MSIFECLPKVNKCCCFTLKTASIMIAVLGILSGINLLNLLETCDVEKPYMTALKYIWAVTEGISFITSIVFLVGIYIDRKVTATAFLYVKAVGVLMHVIFGIISIFEAINKTNCHTTFHVVTWFLHIPYDIYCLIIVRSYREEMEV